MLCWVTLPASTRMITLSPTQQELAHINMQRSLPTWAKSLSPKDHQNDATNISNSTHMLSRYNVIEGKKQSGFGRSANLRFQVFVLEGVVSPQDPTHREELFPRGLLELLLRLPPLPHLEIVPESSFLRVCTAIQRVRVGVERLRVPA